MWLIDGPFDGKTPGVVDFAKTKLLKSGRSYVLGRKAKVQSQIVVSHPKVSAEHVSFIVGEHSTLDVVSVVHLHEDFEQQSTGDG
ncbi:hypothetical protein BD410DRAFT_159448 [Rickenella mellea]|uniref:FHA domain-containing protein n=1 Tax=Rickenella mellea TaxID=50990 RepID=A0A4Y7Q7V9_9AGAM|nr:hypothetical protein BD410DRAFT_159448 [Rickenella mellea]